MEAIISASLPSVSSHSSFVEFRDSSESHGNQVEGAPANTSGVEFQIKQGSDDVMLPLKAISNPETGRDGALEHISAASGLYHMFSDNAVCSPACGCAGVLLPSAQLFIQMQLCRKESLRDWLRTNVETRSRKIILQYFEQVGCPRAPPHCGGRSCLPLQPHPLQLQILDAVCYVHHKGMMHRDLKVGCQWALPGNDLMRLLLLCLCSLPTSSSLLTAASRLVTLVWLPVTLTVSPRLPAFPPDTPC